MSPLAEVLDFFPTATKVQSHWKAQVGNWTVAIQGDPGDWRVYLRHPTLDNRGFGNEPTVEAAYEAAREDIKKQCAALDVAAGEL